MMLRHCKLKSICQHDKVMLNECKFEINIILMFSQFDVSKINLVGFLKCSFQVHKTSILGLD
jgi:hypothetical protein